MGRVYEALKRAAETNGAKATNGNGEGGTNTRADANGAKAASSNGHAAEARAANTIAPPTGGGPERLFQTSRHSPAPETAQTSAPNERTGQPVGSALPDGQASRVAGATLGAAGSTRTPEFVTLDISAARVEPHLVAVTQPRSAHAERYRSLRTRVLHAGEKRKMQAFVITSANIMEGKTLTAVNLAWLLAQTDGVTALLIDGDLRNPCAAHYLGLDAPVGLSEVLGGEAALADSIVRLEPSGLHLLPGGSARDDVAEMLSGPKFLDVLREARRMFDYIIIDAPPLGIFTDATVLINRADAALIVARSGRTRYASLDRVLEPLPRERILGVILNGADEEMNEHSYYYRRYYSRQDGTKARGSEAVSEVVVEKEEA
ncbi:MAG TPA: CpsD/CapB family tyrosine-protein kinase [Pyrinomonadaceae bacterium]|nr:CpsD/CapB family tyrosine-protein kinase [Pyrinomonadaceae bacterium]